MQSHRQDHDWAGHETCECGQPGCGSYRPPGSPMTMREMRAAVPKSMLDGELLCDDLQTNCPASDDGHCAGGFAMDADDWLRCHGPQ